MKHTLEEKVPNWSPDVIICPENVWETSIMQRTEKKNCSQINGNILSCECTADSSFFPSKDNSSRYLSLNIMLTIISIIGLVRG